MLHNPSSSQRLKNRIADARTRLYRVALAWCGDAMLADDLVQETIESGISHHRQLRDDKRLFAWLYSILHNHWHRYLRRDRSHAEWQDGICCEDVGPQCHCLELEIVDRVRRVVASLPVEQREVISLVDLEELSYGEVAEVLNIPLGTVMSRLHRARKHLLARMRQPEAMKAGSKNRMRIIK